MLASRLTDDFNTGLSKEEKSHSEWKGVGWIEKFGRAQRQEGVRKPCGGADKTLKENPSHDQPSE